MIPVRVNIPLLCSGVLTLLMPFSSLFLEKHINLGVSGLHIF